MMLFVLFWCVVFDSEMCSLSGFELMILVSRPGRGVKSMHHYISLELPLSADTELRSQILRLLANKKAESREGFHTPAL